MNFSFFIKRLDKILQTLTSIKLINALVRHNVLVNAEQRYALKSNLSTIIDIGANRGQFSLAARHWAPHAKIIAFEPLPKPAQIFRNLFFNDKNIILHEAAIGPCSGRSVIHISAKDDSSSILPISKLQTTIFPGTDEIATLEIQIEPLNNFITPNIITSPSLLKIDVQGYELSTLIGCESLLSQFDQIYCECSFIELYFEQKLIYEIIQWLADRNFRISGIYNPIYDTNGKTVQADILFERA